MLRNNIQKRKLQLQSMLAAILLGGFIVTSLISFTISRSVTRDQISSRSLPFTSDTIYSEIQRDILHPVDISAMMARNTFMRDWMLAGEQDPALISKYLNQIMTDYNTDVAFLVSDKTRTYYHARGILKTVQEDEPRDVWYFRVREMPNDYEINIDPDLANKDALTIFINHKVFDYEGNYLGAAGVGLTLRTIEGMAQNYKEKFGHDILFFSPKAEVAFSSNPEDAEYTTLRDMPGIKLFTDDLLADKLHSFSYVRDGNVYFANCRFIPELNWFLLVTQSESTALSHAYRTMLINLGIGAVIGLIILFLTSLTINAYQRALFSQQEEILQNNLDLETKNRDLETALQQVKRLSGMLPICASCKKIRDDKGYWRQIEAYIHEHSEAQFSHGICPECTAKLYPDLNHDHDSDSSPIFKEE